MKTSEVLRVELERFNVGGTTVCLGVVKTGIFQGAKMKGYKKGYLEKAGSFGTKPETVADKIVRALRRNKPVVLTDLAKVIVGIRRFSPSLSRGF